MFQQMVTFNGIDTSSRTSYGNYNFRSKLSFEAEAISISNRPDVNAHLSKVSNNNVMSEFIENEKKSMPKFFHKRQITHNAVTVLHL